jgi:hypothetical protein
MLAVFGMLLVSASKADVGADGGGTAVPANDVSLLSAADELAAAVRARDVQRLLRLVAADGVPCIDANVSRKHLEKQLGTRGSWLNAYFLGPEVFKQKFANPLTPMSFAEFLAVARDLRTTLSDRQFPKFPCVRFTASNIKYAPNFCFRRHGNRWVLGDLPNCG